MLLVIVAVVATALIAGATVGRPVVREVCWMLGIGESTYYGWHTSRLRPGQSVFVSQEFRGKSPDEAMRDGFAPTGDILAPRGAHASVLVDPAWDEDSCYPDRRVGIKLSASGIEVAVPRVILHR